MLRANMPTFLPSGIGWRRLLMKVLGSGLSEPIFRTSDEDLSVVPAPRRAALGRQR